MKRKMMKEEIYLRDKVRQTCVGGDSRSAQKAITALVRACYENAAKVVDSHNVEGDESTLDEIAAAIRGRKERG